MPFRKIAILLTQCLTAAGLMAQSSGCLLQFRQAGPVRIGMTVPQARLVLPGATFQMSEDADHMSIVKVMRAGAAVMDLYPDADEGRADRAKIQVIRVYDPKCATAQGVHPGMPLAGVEKEYGKLIRLERTEVESREYAEFEKLPAWLDVQTGNGGAGVYPKHKRCAGAYVETAKVESLWISQAQKSRRFFLSDAECEVPGAK